mmetsp:Transcript_59932/g.119016  ORF Transcript_59932/g.119016 Transcript_59932/m.119016 type:complete len:119 (-) Transcript_59932:256-612(-)
MFTPSSTTSAFVTHDQPQKANPHAACQLHLAAAHHSLPTKHAMLCERGQHARAQRPSTTSRTVTNKNAQRAHQRGSVVGVTQQRNEAFPTRAPTNAYKVMLLGKLLHAKASSEGVPSA